MPAKSALFSKVKSTPGRKEDPLICDNFTRTGKKYGSSCYHLVTCNRCMFAYTTAVRTVSIEEARRFSLGGKAKASTSSVVKIPSEPEPLVSRLSDQYRHGADCPNADPDFRNLCLN
jgi:hypothetical protein